MRIRTGSVVPLLTMTILLGSTLAVPADQQFSETLSATCYGCHGPEGVSYGEHIPSIAGLDVAYLVRVLNQYKEGRRSSTVMERIAKGYKGSELRRMARTFARKPWVNPGGPTNDDLVAQGAVLHQEHCQECHQNDGRYQDRDVPRIAGQRAAYLLSQMHIYQAGTEKLPQPGEMAERLALLDDKGLAALSAFYGAVQDQ